MRLNDFWDDFVQPKSLSAIFQSPEDDLPESGRFQLTTSRNRQAPVSHLTASTNRGRWLTGAGWFRLVVSQNRPGPSKSSSRILGLERMGGCPLSSYRIYKMTFRNREKSRKVTLVGQSHRRNHQATLICFKLLSWVCIIKKNFFICRPSRILLRIEWA